MSPLAVGPFLALVGIVAAFFVLRGKAKTRKSMYRTLRERRELDLRKARERATAAKGATERTAIERETAAQAAAAAAAAPPVGPASAATIQTPAQDAAPPDSPAASAPTPPAPAYTPQEPTYTPPEPPPPPPPAPVEQAPSEVLPEPPPAAGEQTKPAWEIVQPEKPQAEAVPAAAAAATTSTKASWELDPREQQRIDELYKKHGRIGAVDEEDDSGEESLGQVLLSYAGLVLALLVILLGILFMIGGKATH
jgi:hypothetical protein